jgi:hypothetical protein
MRRLSALAVLLAIPLVFLGALPADAQSREGSAALYVTVRSAATQQPLAGAQVLLHGVGIGGTADRSGAVRMDALPVGSQTVEVRYLGYAPEQVVVPLRADHSTSVAFELSMQPIQLAEVRVRTMPSVLKSRGFIERRGSGFGTFITRQQIVDMRPRYMSDVLRRVAGVNLTSSNFGGQTRASIRGNKVLGACPIQYYLDGALTSLYNIDEIQPDDVEGIEIYRGAATIPPSYNNGTALCGVIVIWTRMQ